MSRKCSVCNCEKPARLQGLCSAHYHRKVRYGTPEGGRMPNGATLIFLNQIAIPYTRQDCLIWPFTKSDKGYAQYRTGGKTKLAHVYVCEAAHGPSPSTAHQVAHSCGNGSGGCVNPKHLRWATNSENQMDRVAHGTSNRGSRQGRSKLTELQVLEIKRRLCTHTQLELAEEFGVSASAISLIKSGKTWFWLKEESSSESL
ncbi:HNH endonuclease signature motif containing protein [Rhizobium sp. No.120]